MNLKTLRHAGTRTFLAGMVLALTALRARTQQPDISELAPYRPELKVSGGLRIAGRDLFPASRGSHSRAASEA
jgi:hypothetical protein